MPRRLFPLLALVPLLLASCRPPLSMEQFVRAEDRAADGYHFSADLADTAHTYDFTFYTRLDGRAEELPAEALPLTVTWLSPSLERFTETVWLDVSGRADSWFSRQIYAPYRRGVAVREPGWWQLVVDMPETPALRGLGLRVAKTKLDDGTRQTP